MAYPKFGVILDCQKRTFVSSPKNPPDSSVESVNQLFHVEHLSMNWSRNKNGHTMILSIE